MNDPLQQFQNQVFLGDVMDLLKRLPDKSVDMIYSDPDYNVGIKYGDKSYSVSFERYIEWYIALCKESLRVLKDDGNMFLINYPKQNSYLRVKYLDQVCHEVFDYSWIYNTNIGHSRKHFTTAHRSVLHCTKTKYNKFYKENVTVPYKNPTDKRIQKNMSNGSTGRMPYDWFYFDLVKNVSREKTFHACQIPQKLAEMLIKASTLPADTVLVHFGGSGSELEVCRKLGRNFISAEIDEKYYQMIEDRINTGKIDKKYRLNYEEANVELTTMEQLRILERNKQDDYKTQPNS